MTICNWLKKFFWWLENTNFEFWLSDMLSLQKRILLFSVVEIVL